MEQYLHSFACMGTVVTMQVLSSDHSANRIRQRDESLARATAWFHQVEQCCSRFDASSELQQLCSAPQQPVTVSDLLFECVQFGVAVARATNGAFDPTVGTQMERRGFNRDYRTGALMHHSVVAHEHATYRDVELHEGNRTITLHKPLQLDLGAIAKGLAVDMAARELRALANFMIDAGGDLYVGGLNAEGGRWKVGIRHPRARDQHIHTFHVSDASVCTSGDYERTANDGAGHILHAGKNEGARELASVTVLAPSAMVADALATAAFALGLSAGRTFLEQQGVDGLLITPELELLHARSVRVE
ncbi:MAG: FAD:protein FMN transferase [Phycisphaerae bacterium]|nr:FAD:protein FMN transferase [Gemmatimonadaceae bacterium]